MICVCCTFQRGNGRVENNPLGEYTIALATPGFPAGKNEIFSIEFITACWSTCKKLDIRDFRYYCS
jgi:hypothetical protein